MGVWQGEKWSWCEGIHLHVILIGVKRWGKFMNKLTRENYDKHEWSYLEIKARRVRMTWIPKIYRAFRFLACKIRFDFFFLQRQT